MHFWKTHYEAYIQRRKTVKRYQRTHAIRKLHVGCGSFNLESWLNSDLYGNETTLPLNLNDQFPIDDGSFDYVFSEHVIEHFSFQQGRKIFQEVYRILRKKGKVRVATPDLMFLIELYQKKKTPLQKEYIQFATDVALKDLGIYKDTFVINNFVRAWGHQFIYDFDTMKWLLSTIGFTHIAQYKPGKSDDVNLQNIESHGKAMGEKFNELETFVIEATKP